MPHVSVVVTSYDQRGLVDAAVASVTRQTLPPRSVVVVDDGSTDPESQDVLSEIAASGRARVVRVPHAGVSAARNIGIALADTGYVAVLDGDDEMEPTFLERTTALLDADASVVAASSWLRTHGVLETVVRPGGGAVVDFLHRNACPATAVLRHDAWYASGGYDETMLDGFEDWDFFLGLLGAGGRVAIVPEPLIRYRTAPASANVRSMSSRLEIYGRIIDKHRGVFARHLSEAILGVESRAIELRATWEALLAEDPRVPLPEVTYGDGGLASAVRVCTARSSPTTAPVPAGRPQGRRAGTGAAAGTAAPGGR
ncbi:glycosyltransferase involved in cell wall biosynthesis [Cellulosimicrobium cellulans]|uniref:glycosyltransferase family 2 protein n=1 Tax=Cellulosimicrobium cellulans TaxID=1710 RepID=UPI00195EBE8D|nr:glycosyltransferase family A protein [Cellulosimicrobium cellulans]MBM7818735.1 glycosyltransferase involved in cell wall biosynthesis [Cellulosimicrobium cellulans]